MALPKPTTPMEHQVEEMDPTEEEEEEAEEEMLEDVLRDVALIEAALADSGSSLALDAIEIFIDDGGSDTGGSDNENSTILDTVIVPSPRLRAGSSVPQEAEAFASKAEPSAGGAARWQPDPFEYPNKGSELPWRRAWLRDHDSAALGLRTNGFGGDADHPPTELMPMAAACVLLLLLSSWGQLRRSRRRVLERQEDAWRRDVDLVEWAYRDQTPSNAVLR